MTTATPKIDRGQNTAVRVRRIHRWCTIGAVTSEATVRPTTNRCALNFACTWTFPGAMPRPGSSKNTPELNVHSRCLDCAVIEGKKAMLKFTVDCQQPADDTIITPADLEKFFKERILGS